MKALCVATGIMAALMSGLPMAKAEVPFSVIAQMGGAPTLAPILKTVSPAVVSIRVQVRPAEQASVRDHRKARRGPRAAAEHEEIRAGSGVVLSAAEGLVITNNHVVDHAEDIIVRMSDGRELGATLVGADRDTDIAVIKVEGGNLAPMSFGDSDQLQVGDFVIALGTPVPVGRTVTSGIVAGYAAAISALPRSRTSFRPTPRSIPAIPAARWSTCVASSSASIPAISARAAAIPAWALLSRSTWRAV